MMQKYRTRFLVLLSSILFSLSGFAQLGDDVVTVSGNINSDLTLTNDKRYQLIGFVNVDAGATLTIEPGTIIFGDRESKATLIINRGAYINAVGTPEYPIVFTSPESPGFREPGDWGGIIIAGYASVNTETGLFEIEGGTGTIAGGGLTPDDDDSSGVMKYVRLEYSGIAFAPDNEINGLSMAGVGRRTVIEYFQVSYNGDDAFEWWGGTINHKYLIALAPVDDDWDTDLGYSGKLQFGFSIRHPNIADISGSNGFETDGNPTGDANRLPRTSPIYSNFTVIGPKATPESFANQNFRRGIHARRATQTSVFNSIIMGFPTGILLDGAAVANDAQAGELAIRNTIVAQGGITTNVEGFDADAWFNTGGWGNAYYETSAEVMLQSPFTLANPNPIPMSQSPASTGADFSHTKLQDPFFTPVSYRGAFDPNGDRWDLHWAEYNPQLANYSVVTGVTPIDNRIPEGFMLEQNYPNPFNPTTVIRYTVPSRSLVNIVVYDQLGREVRSLVNQELDPGTYEANFDAGNLSSGTYFYKLTVGGFESVKRMVFIK
jgi:hypothetical protein